MHVTKELLVTMDRRVGAETQPNYDDGVDCKIILERSMVVRVADGVL